MNTGQSALQVGVLVLIGIAMFVGGYVFFKRDQIGSTSYVVTISFRDAMGVRAGSDVEFSGVLIGHVEEVSLSPSGAALVQARIEKKYQIPTTVKITIQTSMLGSTSVVEITPSPKPAAAGSATYYAHGATIQGGSGANLSELTSQATVLMQHAGVLIDELKVTSRKTNNLLDSLSASAQSANKLLGDPALRGGLTGTVENIHEASNQARMLATEMGMMVHADNAMVQTSLRNVNASTRDLSEMTRQNRAKIDSMISNLDTTSRQVSVLVANANRLIDQTSTTLDRGNTVQNLSDTVANLKIATDKLNAIEEDVRSITGDKTVQSNLRQTVANVAQASGSTNQLIARLNELSGGHASHGPGFNGRLVFWENLRDSTFRTDVDLYAPYGNQNFIRAGVRDLTEQNHLNFQVGQRYNDRASMRAGVYDSKVAIGLDYKLFSPDLFTVDLYDPNDWKLDLRQRFGIGNGTALWLGMEDIPKSPGVALGFELSH